MLLVPQTISGGPSTPLSMGTDRDFRWRKISKPIEKQKFMLLFAESCWSEQWKTVRLQVRITVEQSDWQYWAEVNLFLAHRRSDYYTTCLWGLWSRLNTLSISDTNLATLTNWHRFTCQWCQLISHPLNARVKQLKMVGYDLSAKQIHSISCASYHFSLLAPWKDGNSFSVIRTITKSTSNLEGDVLKRNLSPEKQWVSKSHKAWLTKHFCCLWYNYIVTNNKSVYKNSNHLTSILYTRLPMGIILVQKWSIVINALLRKFGRNWSPSLTCYNRSYNGNWDFAVLTCSENCFWYYLSSENC